MKEIKLLNLKLKNFKCFADATFEFGKKTNIKGCNGSGKTTVMDAYSWLLFGKDSHEKADFEIKRKVDGKVQHNLEYSVEGLFELNGKEITITKILEEKWVKKRGTKDAVFNGHTTQHLWNNVPVKKKDFDDKIKEIFDIEHFQMISDPLFFLDKMSWKDRRNILFNGAKQVKIEGFEKLKALMGDKTLDELKKEYSYSHKKLKTQLDAIPIKIDTLTGQIAEVDLSTVKTELERYNSILVGLDAKLQDQSKLSDEKLALQQEIYNCKAKIQEIENAIRVSFSTTQVDYSSEIDKLEKNIADLEKTIKQYSSQAISDENKIKIIEKEELPKLREEVTAKHSETFTEEIDTKCPTCGQELPAEEIEAVKKRAIENFNLRKNREVAELTKLGKSKASNLKFLQDNLQHLESKIAEFKEELKTVKNNLALIKKQASATKTSTVVDFEAEFAKNKQIQEQKATIVELETKLANFNNSAEIDKIKAEKSETVASIKELEKCLSQEEFNTKLKVDIKALEAEQEDVQQRILDSESILFDIQQFVIKKIEAISEDINSQFKYVQFKLFEENITNDGVSEVCVPTVNGIDFSSVNNASRINAGVEVINVLSKKFGISVPIWIDNRESVIELLDTDAQIINLIVNDYGLDLKIEEEK